MGKTDRKRASALPATVSPDSLATTGKYGNKKILMGTLLCIGGALFLTYLLTCPDMNRYTQVTAVNGKIEILLTTLVDGKAHYYSLAEGGKMIRFFIVKGTDGQIRSAFDYCNMCGRMQRGFAQKGQLMICRNCTQNFSINLIEETVTGGCNPIPLPYTVVGRNLNLNLTDILNGRQLFE